MSFTLRMGAMMMIRPMPLFLNIYPTWHINNHAARGIRNLAGTRHPLSTPPHSIPLLGQRTLLYRVLRTMCIRRINTPYHMSTYIPPAERTGTLAISSPSSLWVAGKLLRKCESARARSEQYQVWHWINTDQISVRPSFLLASFAGTP